MFARCFLSEDISYSVYILQCGDNSLYTGLTRDIARRLAEHQAGRGGRYTRSHLPVELVFEIDDLPGYAAACRVEQAIKRMPRARKLRLVAGDAGILARLRRLAKSR